MDVQWPTMPDPHFAEDASAVLNAMTQDPHAETRVQGLVGLAKNNSPEAITTLVHALDDPAPQVRSAALRELGILAPERLLQELLDRLNSPEETTRTGAQRALPRLRQLLEDPALALLQSPDTDSRTRPTLVRALGLMGSENAVPVLSSFAKEPADTRLTRASARALAEIASPEGLPALEVLSQHPSASVRAEALAGLARIGGPVALSAIEAMALNPREREFNNRRQAIGYIGLLGGESSIEPLINVMNRYPRHRETAIAALMRITGLNLGNSPLEWTRWYYKREEARKAAQQQQQQSGGLLGIISPRRGNSPPPGEGEGERHD
jgi:HEAT repeat protein